MTKAELVPYERVENAIRIIRGHRVMLDTELAALYEVEPRALIQAVKRNIERFPTDFMFQLTKKLSALEKRYDAQFRIVFDTIRDLMGPPQKTKKRIGFREEDL